MPKAAEIAPIHIGFLVVPGFQPIDLSGPWQAFTTVNDELQWPRYALTTYGPESPAQTADGALRVLLEHSLDTTALQELDTLIIPGGDGIHRAITNLELLRWLRARDLTTRRTCSVCTGAFLLAATGLLDGQSATTHWRAAVQLREDFPAVRVEDQRIFCESGKYWTSAGVTAGIDLALALIERDCGVAMAQRVARRLVVHLRRSGDQRQYSATLSAQDRAGQPFRALIDALEKNLSSPWSVDDMADHCHMSRRTFQRKFKQHFGVPPHDLLKALREENARQLLNSGKWTRKALARQSGISATRWERL